MSGAKGEFQEPWRVEVAEDGWGANLHTTGTGWRGYLGTLKGSAISSADERVYAARVIACVNFLAGIPTERLTTSDPAACMFLAWLRGDDAAALAWADEVQERARAGEGYVSRAELEKEVAGHRVNNRLRLIAMRKAIGLPPGAGDAVPGVRR